MIQSFHHTDFKSPDQLISQKQKENLSLSLVLPALNEEATIGSIIQIVQRECIEKFPLLDELIVLDGNSVDRTADVAKAAGAKVINVSEVSPAIECHGKGASLWKSQFVTTGDIVLFLDADILNFDARFIFGLAGPLLFEPQISFVKAFYSRPLVLGNDTYQNYGGRVTEILVRPLLCTLLPELSSIHQPLAGEYGIRRNVMESLAFSSGYGVEICLLIEMLSKYGVDGIAQVDMGERLHRNRPINELSLMSFGIIQVMLRKLESLGYLSLQQPLNSTFQMPQGSEWLQIDLQEVELQPKNSKFVAATGR